MCDLLFLEVFQSIASERYSVVALLSVVALPSVSLCRIINGGGFDMTIAAILKQKGGDVIQLSQEAGVAEAVALMTEKRIGALVVCNAENPCVGIISERDVMRALAAYGAAAMEKPVDALMSRDLITVSRDVVVDEAMALMTGYRCRHLPVIEEGHLLGMVSIGDLVNYKISMVHREADALKSYIQNA